MSVMDPWHERHEASVHDHVPDQRLQNPVLNPEQWNVHVQHEPARVSSAPPPPPPGGNNDDPSSSSSDDDALKRKRKKKGPYKIKNVEVRLSQYPNALSFSPGIEMCAPQRFQLARSPSVRGDRSCSPSKLKK